MGNRTNNNSVAPQTEVEVEAEAEAEAEEEVAEEAELKRLRTSSLRCRFRCRLPCGTLASVTLKVRQLCAYAFLYVVVACELLHSFAHSFTLL